MDLRPRRQPLETFANPDSRLDYATTLAGQLTFAGITDCVSVELSYVPDKLILIPESFADYLNFIGAMDWESLEQLATTVMSDVNNEVVGRWVRIRLSRNDDGLTGLARHCVLLEDRQPNWENAALLDGLEKG